MLQYVVHLSVCPSVCLSVCDVHAGWNTSKKSFTPHQLKVLAGTDPNIGMGDLIQRDHPKIPVEYGWRSDSEQKICNKLISQAKQDRTKITMTG